MKKIYSLLIVAILFAGSINAQVVFQSDFSNWANGVPSDWFGSKTSLETDSIIEVTTGAVYGSSSAKLVNKESSHKRLTTQALTVAGGQSYEIKFWVKGMGDIRTALFDTTYGNYNSYITVNDQDFTMYSQTLTANANSDSAQFIISFINTDDAFIIDSVSIEAVTLTIPDVSVYDIQYTTDASGDSPYKDQTVNTGGIVTAVLSSGYFIQSGNGPWTGVYVYDSNSAGTVAIGDSVTFQCLVVEYYNMTELKNLTNFNNVSSGNTITYSNISTNDVNQEQYEACYIKVTNATCTNADLGYGEWEINDNSGACRVDDKMYAFTPVQGTSYNVTGVVDYSYSNYKIQPRDANDIEESTDVKQLNGININVYPNPTSDVLNVELSNTNNVKIELADITGKNILTVVPSTNKTSLNLNDFKNGVYFVKIINNNSSKVYRIVKK